MDCFLSTIAGAAEGRSPIFVIELRLASGSGESHLSFAAAARIWRRWEHDQTAIARAMAHTTVVVTTAIAMTAGLWKVAVSSHITHPKGTDTHFDRPPVFAVEGLELSGEGVAGN